MRARYRFGTRRAASAVAVVAAMLVLVAAVGCGGASNDSGADQPAGQFAGEDQAGGGSAPNPNPVDLTMQDNTFTPADLQESAGATIAIENRDTVPHTFTVDDEKIDVEVDPGDEVDVPLDLPAGSYTFHCTIHPEMTGTLTLS
jgi:plastocyanin